MVRPELWCHGVKGWGKKKTGLGYECLNVLDWKHLVCINIWCVSGDCTGRHSGIYLGAQEWKFLWNPGVCLCSSGWSHGSGGDSPFFLLLFLYFFPVCPQTLHPRNKRELKSTCLTCFWISWWSFGWRGFLLHLPAQRRNRKGQSNTLTLALFHAHLGFVFLCSSRFQPFRPSSFLLPSARVT